MTLDAGKILRGLADRLEVRANQAHHIANGDPPLIRNAWLALGAEIRAAVAHAEREDFIKPLVTATKQAIGAQFDETRLIKPADLDAIQRIGRDHEEGSTTIDLGIFDNVIDGYRYLHEQLLGARHKIAALEEALQAERAALLAERETRTYTPRVDRFDDPGRCPGNCSRGGDGPACGRPGCRG